MRIYFDVCCLHRPLDDQMQERIRLESEAVTLLLGMCGAGVHRWVCSEVVRDEIERNPDEDQRAFVGALLRFSDEYVRLDENMWNLGERFVSQGLHLMDALHLAVAESSKCDFLLTTDDDFLRRALSVQPPLRTRVVNPTTMLIEGPR